MTVSSGIGQLHVSANQVHGWGSYLYENGYNKLTIAALHSVWYQLQELGVLRSEWDAPASIDLLIYTATLISHRRQQNQKPTEQMHRLRNDLWSMFGPLLSELTCTYITDVYAPLHNVHDLPTSIRHRRQCYRRCTLITHEAKWAIMSEAREAGVPLSQALAVHQHSDQHGNTPRSGFSWIEKKLWMYADATESHFAGCKTVNLLVDQGKFDGRTYSFGVHYSWEKDQGNDRAKSPKRKSSD